LRNLFATLWLLKWHLPIATTNFGKEILMSSAWKKTTKKFGQPVILVAQPEKFTLFGTPAKLVEWERLAGQRFGLQSAVTNGLVEAARGGAGSCCESGATNDCDVDFLQ
jgi:hypothetical protein